MNESVVHYYPDAIAVFVKGFRPNEVPTDQDAVVATTLSNVKELMQVSITLTVKNNPGSFSLTIMDTDNKYIYPDQPTQEVPALFERSNKKAKAYTAARNQNRPSANYYDFATYKDWLEFEFGTLEDPSDSNYRSMIYYRRDQSNAIVERWAFLRDGSIVYVVKTGDAAAETDFQALESGSSRTYVVRKTNRQEVSQPFVVWKNSNRELLDRFKSNDEQGLGVDVFKRGRCKISPMDRVIIFMTKRFTPDGVMCQTPLGPMTRVFTGVVNSVQQGFSSNHHTITVSGEDVTKYLRVSVINVNPALLEDALINPDKTQAESITIWENIFKGLDAPDIIRLITTGGSFRENGEFHRQLTGVGLYTLSGTAPSLEYDPDTDNFVPENTTRPNSKRANRIPRQRVASIQQMLGELFQEHTVHIIDPFNGSTLQGFRPYEKAMKGMFSFYQSDYKTRREIAYQVADDTHFVFYADRFGHIWFHPPRYSNGWLLGSKSPWVYVIKDDQIISFGFIEDDANIYSSVYVKTEPNFGRESMVDISYQGAFRDQTVLLKYGQRIMTMSNPLIKSGDAETVSLFAKSMLQRLLAGKYQGQVTLTGRAEIDPGWPIYIPARNMFYYVETVEHSLEFGGQYTTTLHLAYGRKPWEFLPEVLAFSASDDIYLTDGILRTPSRPIEQKVETLTEMQQVVNINRVKTDSPYIRTLNYPSGSVVPAKAF